MTASTAYQLQKGDIEAGTECQARDSNLNLKEWVVRCPNCGSYTHRDCWRGNGNHCPRQGCSGSGDVSAPTRRQRRAELTRPASQFLSPLQATDSAEVILSRQCGRDGGRFLVGDRIVPCPVCGMSYHEHCWDANGDRCSQPGCPGAGALWTRPVGVPRMSNQTPIPVVRKRENPIIYAIKLPFRIVGFFIGLMIAFAIITGLVLLGIYLFTQVGGG